MIHATVTPLAITRLVHEFCNDVRADPVLFPLFDAAIGSNWDAHERRVVAFWSAIMLGTQTFQGDLYGKHLLIIGIRKCHFTRWLALFDAACERTFASDIAADLQSAARQIAASLQQGFFKNKLFSAHQHERSRSDGASLCLHS